MPDQTQQTKYMDLNTFLEKWFSMEKESDRRVIADLLVKQWHTMFNRRTSGRIDSWNIDQYSIKDFKDIRDNLYTEQGKEIMTQFINAMAYDISPEATDFLQMLENLTPFYSRASIPDNLIDQYSQMQVNIIGRGKVKDPKHAYMLLGKIQLNNRVTSKIFLEALHLKVTNPNATLDDVEAYADHISSHPESRFYADAPEELMAMLNDQMVKIDKQITAELEKDVPNMDNIRNLRTGNLLNIAKAIHTIMSRQGYSKEQLDEMSELKKLLVSKYDINKILDVEQGNYVQKFEKQASMRLAEKEAELAQIQKQLNSLKSDMETQKEDYEQQIATLEQERDNQNAEQERFMKILAMKIGAIKMFLQSFDEKKEIGLHRGRELAKIGEFLKTAMYGDPNDPEKSYNWIKEVEKMLAKRKTEQMQGAKI